MDVVVWGGVWVSGSGARSGVVEWWSSGVVEWGSDGVGECDGVEGAWGVWRDARCVGLGGLRLINAED